MLSRKQEKTLATIDLLTIILSLLAMFVFTICFIVVRDQMHYVFGAFIVIAIIFFSSSASNLEDYLKEQRRLKKAIKEDKALNMKTA